MRRMTIRQSRCWRVGITGDSGNLESPSSSRESGHQLLAPGHRGHVEINARPGLLNVIFLAICVEYDFQMLAPNSFFFLSNKKTEGQQFTISLASRCFRRTSCHPLPSHPYGENNPGLWPVFTSPTNDTVLIQKPGWPRGVWDVHDA